MAAYGLEVRVPFLDKDFVNYCNRINPLFKRSSSKVIEKKILREAFLNYLPNEILWRPKEAFSDAVSSENTSWYKKLQNIIEYNIKDYIKLYTNIHAYSYHCIPMTLEALYYRKIFESYYPGCAEIIPKYWMPKWQNEYVVDPSATVLNTYNGNIKNVN